MEVGQGPDWGCSAKERNLTVTVNLILYKRSTQLETRPVDIYVKVFFECFLSLSM
jgi:hypothetical protein